MDAENTTIDNDEWIKIQEWYNRVQLSRKTHVNIFDAMQMGRKETRHTRFIGWLLNPQASHGLKGAVAYELFKHFDNLAEVKKDHLADGVAVCEECTKYYSKKSNGKEQPKDESWGSDGKGSTEDELNDEGDGTTNGDTKKGRADVIFKCESDSSHRYLICIEAKVDASLSDGQLKKYYEYINERYKGWTHLFVYLTVDGGKVPDDKETGECTWMPISYAKLLECIYAAIGDRVKSCESHAESAQVEETLRLVNAYKEFLEWEGIIGCDGQIKWNRGMKKALKGAICKWAGEQKDKCLDPKEASNNGVEVYFRTGELDGINQQILGQASEEEYVFRYHFVPSWEIPPKIGVKVRADKLTDEENVKKVWAIVKDCVTKAKGEVSYEIDNGSHNVWLGEDLPLLGDTFDKALGEVLEKLLKRVKEFDGNVIGEIKLSDDLENSQRELQHPDA